VLGSKTKQSAKGNHRQQQAVTNGTSYSECNDETGVGETSCSVFVYQNNISYEFQFSFALGRPGVSDFGCLYPNIDDAQILRVARLFLAHVSFFKPRIPASDGQSVVTRTPQIVSFEKTPLVRINNYSLRFALSWQTRNADYVQVSYTCGPKVRLKNGGEVARRKLRILRISAYARILLEPTTDTPINGSIPPRYWKSTTNGSGNPYHFRSR
jgi:hypothetical protein